MVDAVKLDEAIVRSVLVEVLQIVHPSADIQYRLVGTASALLRGIALPAGDIDLLFKDRQGVEHFDNALSASPIVERLQPPVWLADARQYFARYAVHGAAVELSTVEGAVGIDNDWLECAGRGPWEHFDLVPCGAYVMPTVAVELRLLTELRRNRPERYRPILEHLRSHPCDVALVKRGMLALDISAELQREVLAGIERRCSMCEGLSCEMGRVSFDMADDV